MNIQPFDLPETISVMKNQFVGMADQLAIDLLNYNHQILPILALKNVQLFLKQSWQLHVVDPQASVMLLDNSFLATANKLDLEGHISL